MFATPRRRCYSKCHFTCGSVMSAHPDNAHEKSCDVCGKIPVCRDLNAALSILFIFVAELVTGEKPAHNTPPVGMRMEDRIPGYKYAAAHQA